MTRRIVRGQLRADREIQQKRRICRPKLVLDIMLFDMQLTLYSPHPLALANQHQVPIRLQILVPGNGICFEIHQSIYLHQYFVKLAVDLPSCQGHPLARMEDSLVGLRDGSLLAIICHCPRGTACCRYAIAARQWASIEGRPNAGPQTWSSSMARSG